MYPTLLLQQPVGPGILGPEMEALDSATAPEQLAAEQVALSDGRGDSGYPEVHATILLPCYG